MKKVMDEFSVFELSVKYPGTCGISQPLRPLKILPNTFFGCFDVLLVTVVMEFLPISTHLDDKFTFLFTEIVLGMLVLPELSISLTQFELFGGN